MTADQRIKVLLITARADFGGGPEHIYRLLNALRDRIQFFAACPDDYPYYSMYSKLLGRENILVIPHRMFRLKSLLELSQFCRRKKVKIIHSHGKGAGIYSRLLSILGNGKCIHTFHGIHTGEYSPLGRKAYKLLEKILGWFTTSFIAVSESEAESLRKMKVGIQKTVIIHNGTPLPEKIPDRTLTKGKKLHIVSITRFDHAKNTQLLIPVAENLRSRGREDFVFVLIGSGPEEQKFKAAVQEKKLGEMFRFNGALMNTGDYLVNSFCYISTSLWEGLPLAILEAMSYALPVIATNVDGNRDLIENGVTGFLYETGTPEKAAEYILKLSSDENLLKTISENGRRKISENYTLSKMAEETFHLYRTIR